MPARVEAAILMRGSADRLRKIARGQSSDAAELLRIAHELEDEARKLEAAGRPEPPKP
jgi:hypothetical protein